MRVVLLGEKEEVMGNTSVCQWRLLDPRASGQTYKSSCGATHFKQPNMLTVCGVCGKLVKVVN